MHPNGDSFHSSWPLSDPHSGPIPDFQTVSPRTSVNKGKRKGWVLRDPALLATASDLLLVGRLPQACTLLLRLACSLASIFERHAGEHFGPLLEEALVCFVALLKDLKDPAPRSSSAFV